MTIRHRQCIGVILAVVLLVHPTALLSFSIPNHAFPRIAALYLNPQISADDVTLLARHDVAILNMQATRARPEMLRRLREANPHIVLLAYTLPVEFPKYVIRDIEPNGDGLWHALQRGIDPSWYLVNAQGQELVFWKGHVLMNLVQKNAAGVTYAHHLAEFLKRDVMDTGLWDGIFFDIVFDGIHFLHPTVDLNRDGVAEGKEESNRLWQEGQIELFRTLRNVFDDRALMIANGDIAIGRDGARYSTFVNGRMLEGFPNFYEGGWVGSVGRYRKSEQEGYAPRLNILNMDTENTGDFRNYRRMRFGLTSTLLANGYYNFDYGTNDRSKLWYYDEYDVGLGNPTHAPVPTDGMNGTTMRSAVWRRDFQHGIVLVNATDAAQSVTFREDFEKIHGVQDPKINNGSIVQEVTLAPQDGIILLRPLEILAEHPFPNGSFARIFSGSGVTKRTGFFVYDSRFRGGSDVYRQQVDGRDTRFVVTDGGWVRVMNAEARVEASWQPYGATYTDAIRFAVADVNRDGAMDIVTIPAATGIPTEVKIFTVAGAQLRSQIFPFGRDARTGGSVAVGDLLGDGAPALVIGSGRGRAADVRVFTVDGVSRGKPIRPYGASFRGGIDVAVGDLDGDGRAEIVTGAGPGGGPHVRVFNGNGTSRGKGWFAYKQKLRGGVRVAVADLDQDGRAEILALTTDVFTITQTAKQLTRN